MFTTLGFLLLSTSCLGCGHGTTLVVAPTVAVRNSAETKAVSETIALLEHGSRPGVRDKAARLWRKFDELRHPEIVAALVNALRNDSAGRVRTEAAVSLGSLSPCAAIVHESLRVAAESDAHWGTRLAAKHALKRLLAVASTTTRFT